MLLYSCESFREIPENPSPRETVSSASRSSNCPEFPAQSLTDPESIDLDGKTIQKTGTLPAGEAIGFTFVGKTGREFDIQQNEEICVWVYTPDNQIFSGKTLPVDGTYTVHVEPRTDATTYRLTLESSEESIEVERQKIIQLIEGYLEAKSQLFGPSLDRELAKKFLTGERYEKTQISIKWLQENEAYYDYRLSRLDDSRNFSQNGDTATLEVTITEELSLYRNGQIDPNNSSNGPKSRNYRFTLKKIGSHWKIANIEKLS
ncbi:ARC6/PARC6 family protein [Baaleninema sp.]|uniref:ARC6/PARC6 family protein n=1 Tax=Baaleninema sp. TaxID=3101197 RepID=UPI003D061546